MSNPRPAAKFNTRVTQKFKNGHFLGAFTKLRKATISFVMSVRMEQLGSHWADFHEIWYLRIFRKSVAKIQVSLKSDKNKGYFTWRPTYIFLSYLAHFFLEWEMFQTKVVEKIKTHFMFSIFFFENRAVYEIMWENTVQRGRPKTTIWCKRIASWIHRATNTHTQVV